MIDLPRLGFGGAALGNLYTAVDEDEADATVAAAYEAGIRYFDTAPQYGFGLSETRLGRALARYPRDSFIVSTKVGYRLEPADPGDAPSAFWDGVAPLRAVGDFSADAVRRSFEASLERLGLDRLDIVLLHDPDACQGLQPPPHPRRSAHFRAALDQAYPLLDTWRAEGLIGAVGVGITQWEMLEDLAAEADFNCFLLAGRYNLIDRAAEATFLPMCEERGIRVIIGGPYASGILATGAVAGARYDYAPATPAIIERVRDVELRCAAAGVQLAAAALQFPLRHPAVATVIPGMRSTDEVHANVEHLRTRVPTSVFA